MTRMHPEKPSVGRSTEPLPDIEKVEQWLQKLGEMGDPMGQVASLERLERQLRRARVAELAGRGEFPGLSALQRFVRREKKKAEEWKEQHVARKTRGEIDLRYRAFTAPSGSKELQDHLWEIQQHNEVLRTKAENYFLLHHNADRVARKLGAGRVDELAHAFESSMEVCQQQVLDLIEAYTCGLGDLEEQGKYLKRMLRWYEEADYISRHRYGEFRPFTEIVEGISKLIEDSRQWAKSDASNRNEGSDHELGNAHRIIKEQKKKIKALKLMSGRPSSDEMKDIIDECRFKSSKKANFSKIGERIGRSSKTAKRWIRDMGLLGYAEGG